MTAPETLTTYRSYVLRLWRSSTEEGALWRASLEDVQTGERVGFASLEALMEYLRTMAAGSCEERRAKAMGETASKI